jgi:hypothetical protein
MHPEYHGTRMASSKKNDFRQHLPVFLKKQAITSIAG